MPVDPRRIRTDQERHNAGDVFWLSQTFQRGHLGKALDLLFALALFPFEFMVDGELKEVAIDGALSVFGAEIYAASAIAGLGLIQCPHYRMETQISQGLVQEVLIETPPPPMPVSVLYPHNRHMSPRVRVFVDWLGDVFAGAQ